MTGLAVEHIDLDLREATVLGKGRRRRTAVFGHKACLALDRYLRARASAGRADLPQLWFSTTGRGGNCAMTRSGIYQMLERCGAEAGLSGLHPHMLRNTWAHYARLEGRLHDDEIMRLAGWRSRSMLDRYAASTADQRARDAGKRSSLGDQLWALVTMGDRPEWGQPIYSGNLLISAGKTVALATRRAVIKQKSGYSRSGFTSSFQRGFE